MCVQLDVSEIVAARSTLQGWCAELQGGGTSGVARQGRAELRMSEAVSYQRRIGELEAEVAASPRSPLPLAAGAGGGGGGGRSASPRSPPGRQRVAEHLRHVL